MRINLKQCVWIGVLCLGIGITGGSRLAAQEHNDQHEQDYSKNKNYQLGLREGRDDSAHIRQRNGVSKVSPKCCRAKSHR